VQCEARNGLRPSGYQFSYFFFDYWVCDKADPAIDLVVLEALPLFNAFEAIDEDVTLQLPHFAMVVTPCSCCNMLHVATPIQHFNLLPQKAQHIV